jgi:hypothetical protein
MEFESDDARQKVENSKGSVHFPPPPAVAPVRQEPDIDPEFLAALPEDIRWIHRLNMEVDLQTGFALKFGVRSTKFIWAQIWS